MTAPPDVTRARAFFPVCSTSKETPPSPMWSCRPRELRQDVQSLHDDVRRGGRRVKTFAQLDLVADRECDGVVPKEPARILARGCQP